MNGRKKVRVAVDTALTVMLVLEMFIQFTGEFLHEVIGFAFFATIIVHLALSAAWVKKTARNARAGKLTARRTALAVVGSLLGVAVIALGVSSVAISGILSAAGFAWPALLGSYAFWAGVHTVSAYGLCALVVVHLAMHWAFLASALKVPYDPNRRRAIGMGVNAVAAVGVVALGVAASKALPQTSTSIAESSANQSADADAPSAGAEPDASAVPSNSGAASGKSGRSAGKGSNGASGSSGTSPSAGADSSGSSTSTGSGAADGASGAAANSSGICTLCRKQCSLSAPKCDKPYQAGLI